MFQHVCHDGMQVERRNLAACCCLTQWMRRLVDNIPCHRGKGPECCPPSQLYNMLGWGLECCRIGGILGSNRETQKNLNLAGGACTLA